MKHNNIYGDNNLLRTLVGDMVLTTIEVEEMIGLSRQTINTLLRNEEIPLLKATTNGNLFLKADIETYLTKRLNANHLKNKLIEGIGSTYKTAELFDEMKEHHPEIEAINIYKTGCIAIMDGYAAKSDYKINGMTRLLGPTFVVRLRNGEERWFDGFNCGYGGTGPNGSVDALISLGINKKEAEKLFYVNRIAYVKEDGEWKTIERNLDNEDLHQDMLLYTKDGYLIMLQDTSSLCERDNSAIEFFKKYKYFLPEPVTVEFLTREEAIEKGYYGGSIIRPSCYQIIITDISGRQIWLDYDVKKETMKYDTTVRDVLLMTGLVLPEDHKQSALTPIVNWLDKKIRVISNKL